MDKTKKYLAFSFVMVLVAVTIVSVIGMILLDRKPVILQGQVEATEIRTVSYTHLTLPTN